MNVVFLLYFEKIVCSNSDINQEAIREQSRLGGDGGDNIESTYQLLAIVRNKQYWLYLVNESNMIAKLFDTGFVCDGNT